MPRYGGFYSGGSGGYNSSGKSYSSSKSSSSSSSARSLTPRSKAPSAPEEFVMRFSNGVHMAFHSSDYESDEFQTEYGIAAESRCKQWIGLAVKAALYEGPDSAKAWLFSHVLKEHCDTVLDFNVEKGTSSTC